MVFVFDWLETVSYVVHSVAVGVSQAGRGLSGHGELSGQLALAKFWKWSFIDTVILTPRGLTTRPTVPPGTVCILPGIGSMTFILIFVEWKTETVGYFSFIWPTSNTYHAYMVTVADICWKLVQKAESPDNLGFAADGHYPGHVYNRDRRVTPLAI